MKLTIVIPVYNAEKYIRNTLDSIINQSERMFELLIIDDGSNDNTCGVVEETLRNSNIFNYRLIKKKNGGVSSARNKGLYEALGQYVMFLDGDDFVSKDLVDMIYEYLDKQEADVICWGFNKVKEDKTILANYLDEYDSNLFNMTGCEALNNIFFKKNMWICTGSVAYRKEFLTQHAFRYTEGCSNGEDQEFNYKILSRADKVIFINKVLSFYVQRESSISNSYDIKRFDAINAMKRTYEYINKLINSDLKKIAYSLKYNKMIENYLYNLQSCLMNSRKPNIRTLLRKIDENYPGLNEEMVEIMKSYEEKNRKLLIKVKLFLISPTIYFWLINLNYRAKGIRKIL